MVGRRQRRTDGQRQPLSGRPVEPGLHLGDDRRPRWSPFSTVIVKVTLVHTRADELVRRHPHDRLPRCPSGSETAGAEGGEGGGGGATDPSTNGGSVEAAGDDAGGDGGVTAAAGPTANPATSSSSPVTISTRRIRCHPLRCAVRSTRSSDHDGGNAARTEREFRGSLRRGGAGADVRGVRGPPRRRRPVLSLVRHLRRLGRSVPPAGPGTPSPVAQRTPLRRHRPTCGVPSTPAVRSPSSRIGPTSPATSTRPGSGSPRNWSPSPSSGSSSGARARWSTRCCGRRSARWTRTSSPPSRRSCATARRPRSSPIPTHPGKRNGWSCRSWPTPSPSSAGPGLAPRRWRSGCAIGCCGRACACSTPPVSEGSTRRTASSPSAPSTSPRGSCS